MLKKAQKSAKNAGSTSGNRFALYRKPIGTGKNNETPTFIDDYRLDRYAYIIKRS